MDIDTRIRRTHPQGAVFSDWTAPDGRRLRRMDWPQPPGTPVRGSLIFAGGRGDFIEKYLEVYGHWHRRGWNVTAFDWRGQGKSGGHPGWNLDSFDILIDDFAALLRDWRGSTPGPHAAVAHSMGGHLLLRTIIDRRPALDAAVLVAPMIRINSGFLPEWIAKGLAALLHRLGWANRPVWRVPSPHSLRQRNLTSCPDRYADEMWWWRQESGFSLGAVTWGWLRAAYISSAAAFTPAKLKSIDLPVLFLGSERDRLVSHHAMRSAARLIPHARFETFPDAGHEILRETDPVRLKALEIVDGFLAEHAA